jgi:aspartyl/asparaginyl beta-hydroxylase (cupin superfamily)
MLVIRLANALNAWYFPTVGGELRPPFLDIDQVLPALRVIDRVYEDIRAEIAPVLPERAALPRFHDVDPAQANISATTPNDWRVMHLWLMGTPVEPHWSRFPKTAQALTAVPDLFSAAVSILDPGKAVPAHCGPSCGYLRYHLGLVVPEEDPPTIRVKDQYYTWREGESVVFDDSWEHEVYNTAKEPRIVLIVDVLRPMPLPQRLTSRVAARVARQMYAKPVAQRARDHAAAAQGGESAGSAA